MEGDGGKDERIGELWEAVLETLGAFAGGASTLPTLSPELESA